MRLTPFLAAKLVLVLRHVHALAAEADAFQLQAGALLQAGFTA